MRQLCDYSRHCRNTRTSPQPSRRVRDWNPVPTHEPLQGHGGRGLHGHRLRRSRAHPAGHSAHARAQTHTGSRTELHAHPCTDRHKRAHTCMDTRHECRYAHARTGRHTPKHRCTRTDTCVHAHSSHTCRCVRTHTDNVRVNVCVHTHPNTAMQQEHACTPT